KRRARWGLLPLRSSSGGFAADDGRAGRRPLSVARTEAARAAKERGGGLLRLRFFRHEQQEVHAFAVGIVEAGHFGEPRIIEADRRRTLGEGTCLALFDKGEPTTTEMEEVGRFRPAHHLRVRAGEENHRRLLVGGGELWVRTRRTLGGFRQSRCQKQ